MTTYYFVNMAEKKAEQQQHSERVKGILKHTPSCEDQRTEVHWDEMNILQTYHPSDKDYGHMKIAEPPTPYSYLNEDSDCEANQKLDPEQLALKIQSVPAEGTTSVTVEDDANSSDEDLTQEELETKKVFLDKRKFHYNEYDKVKLARELIEKELAELEDDDDNNKKGTTE